MKNNVVEEVTENVANDAIEAAMSLSTGKKIGIGVVAIAGAGLLVRGTVGIVSDVKNKIIPGVKCKLETLKQKKAAKKELETTIEFQTPNE